MNTHNLLTSAFRVLASALLSLSLAALLHAQSVVTVPAADADFSTFTVDANTVLNFADATSGSFAITNVGADQPVAHVLASGAADFALTGGGFLSTGTLFLGWTAADPALADLAKTPFTGVLDFTGLAANTFAAVELDSGALRISSADQLGVTLSNLNFGGTPTTTTGTLIIAGPNVVFDSSPDSGFTGVENHLQINNNTAALVLDDSAKLTFSGNNATTAGAAINVLAGGRLLLDGRNGAGFVFEDNVTTNNGAAINLAGAGSYVEIWNALFQSNTAVANGLFSLANSSTLIMHDVTIKDNAATGGALMNSDATTTNLTISNFLIESNTTNGQGIIIRLANGPATLSSGTFLNNTGIGTGADVSTGNTIFFANGSPSSILTLNDVSFVGNHTPGAALNGAIGMRNGTNTNFVMYINATTGTSVYVDNTGTDGVGHSFYDWLNTNDGAATRYYNINTGSNTNPGATLDMLDSFVVTAGNANSTGNFIVTKTGIGTWKLGGSSTMSRISTVATATMGVNINEGTLYLYRAGEQVYVPASNQTYTSDAGNIYLIGASANTPLRFSVANGATLSIGGGNTISFQTTTASANANTLFSLAVGSILNFDIGKAILDGINGVPGGAIGDASETAMLTVDVASMTAAHTAIFNMTTGVFNPTITLDYDSMLTSGTYNLFSINAPTGANWATATGGSAPFNSDAMLTSATFVIGGTSMTIADLKSDLYTANFGYTDNILWVSFGTLANDSYVLSWAGAPAADWSADNWLLTSDHLTAQPFADGDIVNLDLASAGPNSITLSANVTPAAMYVSGNADYTIDGPGSITTDGTTTRANLAGSPADNGKLVLGSAAGPAGAVSTSNYAGTLTLANTTPNTFTSGIDINSGQLVGNDQTLGVGSSGSIAIAASGTLTFKQDTAGSYTAPITGVGNLNKDGDATLTLPSDNSAFNGITNILSGTLLLPSTAKLGGAVNVTTPGGVLVGADGAIVGGAGKTLTVGGGGILQVGSGATPGQTLTVGGNLFLDDGAIIDFTSDLHNELLVTGAVSKAASGLFTISVSSTGVGVYNLITADGGWGALSGDASTWLTLDCLGATLATGYTLNIVGNDLQLTFLTSALNRVITWNGSAGAAWEGAYNWTAYDGAKTFAAGDIVNLAGATPLDITLADTATVAAIYVAGASSYTLHGPGIVADAAAGDILDSDPAAIAANGKLVLGQTAANSAEQLNTAAFTGTLDMTDITSNTFTGGVEIHSGVLRVATADQLGISQSALTFAGDDTASGTLAIATGKSIVFDGGAAASSGTIIAAGAGAIYLEDNATMTFSNNVGGAASVLAVTGGTLALATGANARYSFTGNQSTGAVATVDAGRLDITNALFDANTSDGNGAALYIGGSSVVNITSATFSNNNALGAIGGGAIAVNGNTSVITFTDVLFQSNTSAAYGGAIVNNNQSASVYVFNDVSFLDNFSGNYGGAIYANNGATYTFNVSAGHTSQIAGNVETTPSGTRAGGILTHNGGNPTIIFNIAPGGTFDMVDPINTLAAANATAVTITATGGGLMNLGGLNALAANNNTANSGHVNFTVASGTLHLYRAGETSVTSSGSYTATAGRLELTVSNSLATSRSLFALSPYATLSAGGGNSINVGGTISLGNNSTIALDLTDATPSTTGYSVLTFTGTGIPAATTTISANWANINLDLLNADSLIGNANYGDIFNLITLNVRNGNNTFTGAGPDTFASITTLPDGLSLQLSSDKKILQLLYNVKYNSVLTWSGADASWLADTNWNTDATTVPATPTFGYVQGDIINLADTANTLTKTDPAVTAIQVDTLATATISGMYLSGSASYNITGTSIEAVTGLGTLKTTSAATGKLILGALAADDATAILIAADNPAITYTGTLTLDNGSNTFANGIEILSGELIGNAQTLGVGPTGTVAIRDTGVLTINQDDAAGGATYAAPITGNGALNKTGAAALTLTGNNADFGGTTSVSSGSLFLASTLGGDVNVNAATLLGNSAGAASVGGNVTIAGGATLMAGEAGATAQQTFAIGGTLTLDPGATLSYNILTGGFNDTITAASLSILGTGTINISDAITGTYTIVDANTALDGSTATKAAALDVLKNGETIGGPGTRVTAFTLADTDKLLLDVEVANISSTWTGISGNTWNTTAASWANPTDTVFYAHDAVTFADTTSGSIAVDTNGVTAAAMTVDTASAYTFGGGAITTSTIGTTLAAVDVGPAYGKLIKTGAGALVFANTANTFEEGITLEAGSLTGNAATLNTTRNGITTAADTTLTFDQATSATYAANITGGADFIKAGAGNLTLTGLTTYGGTTSVSSGTLTLGNANQIASSSAVSLAANTTLDATSGAQTLNQLSGDGNITAGSGALTLSNSAAATTYAGIISGAIPVTKLGANTLTLAGDNTAAGALTISEGAVQLGDGAAAGSVAGAIVNNAALTLNHGASNATLAGAISGNGRITKLAADTGLLTLTANSSAFTGATDINGGGLNLSNASLGGNVNLAASTTLSGNGSIGGNVTTAGNNVITLHDTTAVPAPTTTSTLTIGGTLFLTDGLTLNYALIGASQNDLLKVGALDNNASGAGTINIAPSPAGSGTFTLITSGETIAATATNFFTTLNGNPLVAGRTEAAYQLDATQKNLLLIFDQANVAGLVWDGTFTGAWAVNHANWKGGDIFLNGDSVIFDNTASGTNAVIVDTAGVSARAMAVNSGAYTYTGGAITTSATAASSLAAGEGDGKLTLAANANVTLSNTAANLFEGGIDIASTAALTGNADTLRVGASLVTPSVIANAGALTFNQTTTATYSAPITGAGSLTKTGAGSLTLAANAAYAAGLTVAQGALTLAAPGATTQGDITIASGASLLITAPAAFTVNNTVTGAGLLSIDAAGATVGASLATPSAFTGTLALANSTFALSGNQTALLANATLLTGTGNTTTVGNGTQTLAGLAIAGGKLIFSTTIPADTQAAGLIQTTTLSLGATGTIQVTIPSGAADVASTGATLFAQATGATIDRLIVSTTVTGAANVGALALIDQNGTNVTAAAQTANIAQAGANVATGTYTYALNATGGLNVNYKLTALTIDTSATLALAPAAGETGVFSTTISGNGNLSIDASAAPVTLGAANNFTGAATVTSGTLVSGANNALGSANTLTLANDAAYDLNGKSQTLSTLTTASTSTLNLNSGNLAIANGGAVNGALAGAGALNLTGGNLAIATANPDLAAPITIAATATATMGDLAALGAGAIANNGALTFANTAPGTLANSITGPGALNLNGAGITTIDHGNSLTGPVAVNGPVVASNLYALGTGDITVGNTNPAATLTYTVGGTIASNITGPGSLNLAASSGAIPVTLVGNNTITTINALDGANIVAANANALRSTYLKLTNATVTLTAPDTALGNVTLNGASKITFANLAAGAATAASLTAQTGGDGATPTLAFNTNIGAGASNTLDVAGPANGTFIIDISNTGNFPTANSTNISLVKAASGAPNYVLGAVTGTTFAGAMTTFNFDLSGTDAASGITLNIVRGDSLSPTGGAIVANATSSMPLTWFAELENIGKRLGDLHITTREKPGSDLWVRGYTQRINVNNKANPVPFNETQYGIEAGLDYGGQFVGQDSSFYVGAFLGYGTSDRDVKDSRVSDGSSINNHGGFYVTIIAPNGSYFDFVCKYDNFKNSLNALSDDGPMNADYHTSAVGASIELGKRTTYKSGWYVIPSVQASAVRINAADYTALTDKPSYNLVVSQEAINTNQLKGGLLAGYTRPLDNGQAIQPYASLYYARQWTSGGAINVRSANFVADEHGPYWSTIEGARVDAAIGFNWQYKKNLQMYFEYECSFARDYKKPYGLTLGIRRSW